jgi:hypothetical protein
MVSQRVPGAFHVDRSVHRHRIGDVDDHESLRRRIFRANTLQASQSATRNRDAVIFEPPALMIARLIGKKAARAPSVPDSVHALIAYCEENARLCPMPPSWSALWELLPDRKRTHIGWEPPPPLILTAWHGTSGLEKSLRLATHIEWADRFGGLAPVAVFLRGLREHEWFHRGE